jgi:hypothetical protein
MYPKSFYQGLIRIMEYDFFPSEAWIIERMLHTIYSGMYEIQDYVVEVDKFFKKISELPDRSTSKDPNKKLIRKILKFVLLFKISSR